MVDNQVVNNTKFSALKTKVNKLGKNIPDATTLIHINQYNTDKQNFEKKNGDVEKKHHHTSSLVTTTVLNIEISEVKNKIPNSSDVVKKTYYGTKI